MPTKKKRVGFIPRDDVKEVIDKLSIENNLSNSKIISILVEEALYVRGIFDKKTGKINQTYQSFNDESKVISEDCLPLKNNDKFTMNTKILIDENITKTNFAKQTNQETFDLQTYKKFISFMKFKEMLDEFNN